MFNKKEGLIAEDKVILITPSLDHCSKDWVKEDLIYRSSVWTEAGFPVSLSLPKFFNLGERDDVVPPSMHDCSFVEKEDGSCLILSFYKGEFIHRTRGTLDVAVLDNGHEINEIYSQYPILRDFEQISSFNDRLFVDGGTAAFSLIFEWVTPTNRIIKEYKNNDVFLIGCVLHDDYSLLTQKELDDLAEKMGVKRPRYYHFNDLDEALASIAQFDGSEGVCMYFNGDQNIVKIKSSWYLNLHRMKDKTSFKNIFNLYIESGLPSYPIFKDILISAFEYENFVLIEDMVKNICAAKAKLDLQVGKIAQFVRSQTQDLNQKEKALFINRCYDGFNKSVAFSIVNGKTIPPSSFKKILWQELKS